MSAQTSPVNSPASPPASRPMVGILWMLVTGLFFVAVTATVKMIDGRVPAAQAAFVRYLFGLVLLLPMIGTLISTPISGAGWRLFVMRGVVHTLGVTLWFFAMSRITIAELTALNYMTPVFVTLGAALFLGERLAARRIAAIGVAVLGALIILRPGFREIELGHLAMLCGAMILGGVTASTLAERHQQKEDDLVAAIVEGGQFAKSMGASKSGQAPPRGSPSGFGDLGEEGGGGWRVEPPRGQAHACDGGRCGAHVCAGR